MPTVSSSNFFVTMHFLFGKIYSILKNSNSQFITISLHFLTSNLYFTILFISYLNANISFPFFIAVLTLLFKTTKCYSKLTKITEFDKSAVSENFNSFKIIKATREKFISRASKVYLIV